VNIFEAAVEVVGMSGVRLGGATADIHHCIAASLNCQAACEAAMEQLAALGMRADSEPMRLLRQCAELCELNARALQKDSRLARRTATLCFELSNQVARATWLDGNPASTALAREAVQLARACRPLLFT
jgi:hypothetical protein